MILRRSLQGLRQVLTFQLKEIVNLSIVSHKTPHTFVLLYVLWRKIQLYPHMWNYSHSAFSMDCYHATACNTMHGIAVAILSICLSVCLWLSVRCMYYDKTKWCTADILIPHERTITLVFWHQQRLVDDAPSLWNIWQKWCTPFEKGRLHDINVFCAGPAWCITTADNWTMNFSGIGTAHHSRMVSLP